METLDGADRSGAGPADRGGAGPSMLWLDSELQGKKKKSSEDSNADNRMLFFAKVLRSATEEDVKAVFSRYGKVYDVNLFRAFQGAPTTKGCGLVTMGTHEEALKAIDALDNKYIWESMESPMVVKWMDAALQRRRREQHLAAMRQGLVPSVGMGGPEWLPGVMMGSMVPNGRIPVGPGILAVEMGQMEMMETPPAGCAPDAIKLFVGNIPKSCSEEQLMPFFETIGKVVELVIVRDKNSHESKGSAFVWYSTRAQAERAILQFNLRHVLPDPRGEQDRPLVVRKAKSRNKGVHPAMGMLAQMEPRILDYPVHIQAPHQGQIAINTHGGFYQAAGTSHQHAVHKVHAPLGLHQHMAVGQLEPIYMQQVSMTPMANAQLVSIQTAPTVQEAGLYEAYGTGPGGSVDQDGYVQAMQGGAGQVQNLESLTQQVAMSIPLNQNQLAAVNNHLFSVQTMSGAQLHISPGAPGLFHLVLTGSKAQVETARNLIQSVLGQAS